jgi:hypothetical protein
MTLGYMDSSNDGPLSMNKGNAHDVDMLFTLQNLLLFCFFPHWPNHFATVFGVFALMIHHYKSK